MDRVVAGLGALALLAVNAVTFAATTTAATPTTRSGVAGPAVTAPTPAAGDMYFAEPLYNRIVKVPADGGAQTTVGTGLSGPFGVTVDAAGNVYIADSGNNRIVKVPVGGGPQTTVGTGLSGPFGVTVAPTGDVYIADAGNNRIVKVPVGGGPQTTVGTGLNHPTGTAIDLAGDVYISDTTNNRIVKVPADGGPQTTVGTGLGGPFGVTLDAAGDVFIADTGNNRIAKVPADGGPQTTVGTGLSSPWTMAVGAAGDVYISDTDNNRIVKVPAGGGPQTTVVTLSSSPYGVAVYAPPPTFTASSPLLTATVDTPYSYTYTASTPAGEPAATFEVASGSLPPGLTLNATTGVLSGTPTTVGAYTFTAEVMNAANGTLATPATITVSAAVTTGFLRVTTSPAVPSRISVDGHVADTWGLQWVKESPGSHTVCFSDIAGFKTPACQNVTVATGVTTTVTGHFIRRGFLKVVTSPVVPSEISIDGHPADNWGVYTDVDAGSHTVCFGAVAGFDPPACQTVTVIAGSVNPAVVTGTFTPDSAAQGQSGKGLLRVTTSPALPSQITVDGHIAGTWGLTWLEIAPGSHTVCYSDVAGYTTPACDTVTVTAGVTTTINATFPQRGFLKVETSPVSPATISIDGHPADDWGVYTDLATGNHHVCFGDVAGLTTPACQNVTLTGGVTTTITGTYN